MVVVNSKTSAGLAGVVLGAIIGLVIGSLIGSYSAGGETEVRNGIFSVLSTES